MVSRPRVLSAAPAWRAWLESVLLAAALLLAVLSAAPQMDWVAVSSGYLFAGVAAGVWGALRARLAGGSRGRLAAGELARLAGFVLLAPGGVGLLLAALGRFAEFGAHTAAGSGAGGLALLAFASLAYLPVRLGRWLWLPWEALQRQRLALSITQTILNVTLLSALLVVLGYVVLNFGGQAEIEAQPGASQLARLVSRLVTFALPVLTAFSASALAALAVLAPLAGWFAYRSARGTTRRLEHLAQVSHRLAEGDLSARAGVQGEDEVAQLQEDFNRMAARLDESRRQLEAEREKVSGLLESRRRLFAAISHDLRTPVATMQAYLDSLERSGAEGAPATWREDVGVLRQEAARLNSLVEDIFLLARTDADRLELDIQPLNARPLLEGLAASFAPYAWQAGGLKLVQDISPELPLVAADGQRLGQAAGNLLRNAVHHTRPGGLVGLFAFQEGDALVIEVRDTGEGIPQEELERIWEPFYRGRGHARGSAGLGLALVKEWVERMGGTAGVESIPGEGSCFWMRFPVIG